MLAATRGRAKRRSGIEAGLSTPRYNNHNMEMGALIGSVDQILVMVIIGCAAGWLAAIVLRVRSIGIAGTMIVGIVGSFIGIVLFRAVDIRIEGYQIGPIPVGHLFAAFVGAILLVVVLRLFRRRRF